MLHPSDSGTLLARSRAASVRHHRRSRTASSHRQHSAPPARSALPAFARRWHPGTGTSWRGPGQAIRSSWRGLLTRPGQAIRSSW